MTTIDRICSDYTVYYNSTAVLWEGRANKCGGTDAASNATLATVMQACITLLSSGGSIFLKGAVLPAGLTYGSTIIIIVDYNGTRKTYSNGNLIHAEGTGLSGQATITAGLTSVVVNHSLGVLPRVKLTPQDDLTGYSFFCPYSTRSTTQFYIQISSQLMANVTFDWEVSP